MDVTKSRNQPCWQGQRGLHYLKRRKGANKPDFCTVGKIPVETRINSKVDMMRQELNTKRGSLRGSCSSGAAEEFPRELVSRWMGI